MGDISKDIKSKFDNPKVKVLINIKYTANWLNSKENEFFKPFGLSPQQYNILRILRGAKGSMKAQTVRERMIDRAPNATRIMDKLSDKGLVERTRCSTDRRVVFINISQTGLVLLEQIDGASDIEFLNNLTVEEATILSDLLDKIR